MTKEERQNKRCFICGEVESAHPGGRFCSVDARRKRTMSTAAILTQLIQRLQSDSSIRVDLEDLIEELGREF